MPSVPVSIAPWLTVQDGARALEFYKAAFDATETYRLDAPDGGVVAKLSIDGADFRASDGPAGELGGGSVRMILTAPDPDAMFARAVAAGASEVFPAGEGHGWRWGAWPIRSACIGKWGGRYRDAGNICGRNGVQ